MENIVVEKDKKTILVVDDEDNIRDLLVFNLQKEGYNTLEAQDGIAAVDMALEKKTRFNFTRCNDSKIRWNFSLQKNSLCFKYF